MWGFESLLPCQFWERGSGERPGEQDWFRIREGDEVTAGSRPKQIMSQVARVKDDDRRGGVPQPTETHPGVAAPEFLRRPVAWVGDRFRRMRQFLHEVRVELRHVTWPSRSDVRATTVVVIITVAFFGLFLFLIDSGLARIVNMVFERFRP